MEGLVPVVVGVSGMEERFSVLVTGLSEVEACDAIFVLAISKKQRLNNDNTHFYFSLLPNSFWTS